MMKLEQYIQQNKQQLEQPAPNKKQMWDKILQGLPEKQQPTRTLWKKIAVAAVVLIVAAVLVRHEIAMQNQITCLAQINKELADKEKQYQQKVNRQWQQFARLQTSESPMEQLLLDELAMLDTIYNAGLRDLKQNGYNDRAVTILLDTYEKRLRIIDRLIYEKQKQFRYENKQKQVDI